MGVIILCIVYNNINRIAEEFILSIEILLHISTVFSDLWYYIYIIYTAYQFTYNKNHTKVKKKRLLYRNVIVFIYYCVFKYM